jgi:hypothetical protein
VVVGSRARKVSVVQGAVLRVPAVVGRQLQLVVMVAPVPHTQRWQHAFAYGDGIGGASWLRYQSQQELGCYTKL